MCGSHPPPIGPFVADIAAGALQGVGVLAAVGPLAPTIAAAFGSRFKVCTIASLGAVLAWRIDISVLQSFDACALVH